MTRKRSKRKQTLEHLQLQMVLTVWPVSPTDIRYSLYGAILAQEKTLLEAFNQIGLINDKAQLTETQIARNHAHKRLLKQVADVVKRTEKAHKHARK